METITIDPANEHRIDPSALHSMFRLRHNVFRQRLGWSVPSQQGLERDAYDEIAPVYLVARQNGRRVTGCLRLLPTTGPYMLRDTFPTLLAGESAPADERTWDISRLAVARADGGHVGPSMINETTVALVTGVLDYALENGIHHYVAVISVALERILRRLGLPMERFGDGRARRIGETLSVAVWIHPSTEARDAIASHNHTGRAA